jgi:diguanylate cyclase (GGDEF)-like protein/PAS domain S-box-containing protein
VNDDLEVMRTGRSKKIEETSVHTSMGEIWIETIKSPVRNEAGRVIGVAGIARNISQRKRSMEELARSEAKYRELVQNAKSIIMRFDRHGKITFFNEYAQEFFGFTEQEILGRHVIGSIVPPTESTGRDLEAMIQYLIAEPDRHSLNENENIRSSGERVWIAWTNHGLSSSSGHVTEILSVGTDISALKKAEAKLRELAITDGLTGLFNRRHFMDLCGVEIDRARRYGHSLSLLMMDIDFFKSVNDKHGHGVGDETLRFVSRIAASNLRKTDIIGRLGGEEFGLLLLETDLSGARAVGEKVRQSIEQAELNTDLRPLRITVSIGVASRSDRDLDMDSLFILADKALYSAKRKGRNRVEVA